MQKCEFNLTIKKEKANRLRCRLNYYENNSSNLATHNHEETLLLGGVRGG
jgi:hypothetical protein